MCSRPSSRACALREPGLAELSCVLASYRSRKAGDLEAAARSRGQPRRAARQRAAPLVPPRRRRGRPADCWGGQPVKTSNRHPNVLGPVLLHPRLVRRAHLRRTAHRDGRRGTAVWRQAHPRVPCRGRRVAPARGGPDRGRHRHRRLQLRRAPVPGWTRRHPRSPAAARNPSAGTAPCGQPRRHSPPLPAADERSCTACSPTRGSGCAAPHGARPVRLRRVRVHRCGGAHHRQPRRDLHHFHRVRPGASRRQSGTGSGSRSATRRPSATPTAPLPCTWAGGAATRKAPSWPWPPPATRPASAACSPARSR